MSFSNISPGPIVSINTLRIRQDTLNDLLNKGFIVISSIVDKDHEIFEMFNDIEERKRPIEVFVTIRYLENYD